MGWENDEVDAEMLTQEEMAAARRSVSSRRAVSPAPAPSPATAGDNVAADMDLVEMGGVGPAGGSRGGGMGNGGGVDARAEGGAAGADGDAVATAAVYEHEAAGAAPTPNGAEANRLLKPYRELIQTLQAEVARQDKEIQRLLSQPQQQQQLASQASPFGAEGGGSRGHGLSSAGPMDDSEERGSEQERSTSPQSVSSRARFALDTQHLGLIFASGQRAAQGVGTSARRVLSRRNYVRYASEVGDVDE